MRDILFRAKKANGAWVYGHLTHNGFQGDCFIGDAYFLDMFGKMDGYTYDVINTTVCQYCGVEDKNSKLAFENDIIYDDLSNSYGVLCYGSYKNPGSNTKFENHIGFYVEWKTGKQKDVLRKDLGFWLLENKREIVGNIFDDKELIGAEK